MDRKLVFQFNQFTLDTDRYQLRLADEPVALEPLVFDLLVYLVEHRDRVVTRVELLDNLWKNKIVTDAALAARLKDLRKAVQDSGSKQAVIRTVHGRGYRFVAEVRQLPAVESSVTQASWPLQEAQSLPDKPSLAVLPFVNLSADPGQEYFSDGITEDIITSLAKIRKLLVIARTSSFTFKGKSVDVRRVGRQLGVRYVLEGSVQKSGKRVRVTAQLVEAATGHQIWAERYDRKLKDIFAVRDEIVREIVVALDVELIEGEQAKAWSSGTRNLEAWECFRLAVHGALKDVSPEAKSSARALLEKALNLDPDYAIARVMLGWIYQQYADVASLARDPDAGGDPLASMLDCAQRAIAADPSCADAYSLLAMYHLELKEFERAQAMAEKAVSLAPNNAESIGEACMVFNKTGKPQRALELIKHAMRICPMYRPGFLRGLGLSYYLLGDLDTAVIAFRESILRESEYLPAHTWLASIYGELGRREDAREPVREIMRLAPNFSIGAYLQGLSFSDPKILTRVEAGLRKAGLPE